MANRFRPLCFPSISSQVLLLFLLIAGTVFAKAQTVSISGTVFDPRVTSNSLPLPNVLVYITTAPVLPLPSGVQCLTYQAPAGAASYSYTNVDGSFTLSKVPINTTYTLVIQAGKWRRMFSLPVATNPISGLELHMPANHSQGDIPRIAIATGSVDAAECVLLDMGIDASEFTDDNGSINASGQIHLYQGSGSPGAQINASTPGQSSLTNSSGTLNSYDMVMFPCQGNALGQTNATAANNLLNFANAGGRLFTTHFSYVWLAPGAPYNSLIPPVANWTYNNEKQISSGTATIETNFSDGATLAQWLQNSGATIPGTANQINIDALRTDVASVVPPTQSWMTLNNGNYAGQAVTNSPVMQMTFNTPVGAPEAQQCGRVMFNDYHVFNVADAGQIFPSECPNPATHVMSAQEKMLEFALFDLSAFVQPVVVPTLDITFNPNPLVIKENDSGDQIVVNVTNTSSSTAISNSAILTFTLPPLVTVSSITDSTGGWSCNSSTLTCTRTTSLAASTTDSVILTFNVGAYPASGLSSYSSQITGTVSSVTFSSNVTASDAVIYQQLPPITWAPPAPIVYGAALSSVQLNATSTIAGTFAYNPPAGTVLSAGQHMLSASFSPSDATRYLPATATVPIKILATTPNVNLSASQTAVFAKNSVTLSASIPVPLGGSTGTIAFYDGSAQIGSGPISNGAVSVTTSSLAVGTHKITAAYSGDNNYGPANSNPITVVVQDFNLTASGGGTATVLPASHTTFTLMLTPVGGSTLPGTITLSHGTLPFGSSVEFSSNTVAASSPATSVILQINMAGSSTLSQRITDGGPWKIALALLLLPFGLKVRRFRAWLVILVISVALATGGTGCGGASLKPQSFSFPVTATSGGLSHAITVNVTVQNNQQD